MQALYLDGRRFLAVEADGPALTISRQDRACHLVPLRRISHIVSNGANVRWSQEALAMCADAGIPVFLIGSEHQLIGCLFGNTDPPSQAWFRLMRLLEDPEGLGLYQTFMLGKRTQVQAEVNERWTNIPRLKLPGYHGVAKIFRVALQADLEAEFIRCELGRRETALLRQSGVDLVAHFMEILEPCVHWMINETWKYDCYQKGGLSRPAPSRRSLIQWYEQKSTFPRHQIRALMISFLYWLAEHDLNVMVPQED